MKWFKENWLVVLVLLIFGFLMWSSITNYFLDKRFDEFKIEKKQLEEKYANLQEKNTMLEIAYDDRQEEINSLETKVDSLEGIYALKTSEMALKEKEFKKIISDLKNVPADTIYKMLFMVYPTDDILKYPFSKGQVRSFYQAHEQLKYSEILIFDLDKQVNVLENESSIKSDIIDNKDSQIDILENKITLSDEYTNELKSFSESVERSYKKERVQKWIWQGATAGSIVYIILNSLKK